MKRFRTAIWILAACLSFAQAPARAAVMTGLYEARVPVTDQSASTRRIALRQALAAVLVKVTGARTAAGPLAGLLDNAAQYMQQYRYEQAAPPPPGDLSGILTFDLTQAGASPLPATGLVLWAKFDPDVIAHALQAAQAPLWGAERPATLVWLAVQDTPGGHIVNAAELSPLMQTLKSVAAARGIPLVFPQMDGPDAAALGLPDITGFLDDRIASASARYKPEAVLVGSLYIVTANQYAARWQLLYGGQQETWSGTAADELAAATEGLQSAADRMATRLAIPANAPDLDGVQLTVQGVTSLDDYASVLTYLGSLSMVRDVHVVQVQTDSLSLSIDGRGALQNLEDAIQLGRHLTPIAPAAGPSTVSDGMNATSALHYRYTP